MTGQSQSAAALATTGPQTLSPERPADAKSLLWKNTLAIGLSRVGSLLLDGCTYIITARYFGPAEYGQYLTILAFLNLVDIASDMAVIDVTVREMSKEPDRMGTWLIACTILRMSLGMLGFAGFAFYISLAHYSEELLETAWVASLLLPAGILRTPLTVFRANMKMHYELGIVIATRALNLLLFVWLVHTHGTMRQFFVAIVCSRILLALMCWVLVLRLARIRISHLQGTVLRLLRESIPMALSGGFVAVQFKADILMLSRMTGVAAAGLYGAVAQLTEYSLCVPVIISTPALPLLSRAFVASAQQRFQQLYGNMSASILSLVIPPAVMAVVMPAASVALVLGSPYAAIAKVLPLLALSIVALWISHATAIGALAVGLQSHFVRIQLICVATYLLLDWLFIPHFGVMAAASVRLIATVIAPLLTYVLVRRAGYKLEIRDLRPPVVAGGLMAATVWVCSGLPVIAAAAIGLVVYAAALSAVRRLSFELFTSEPM